MNNFTAVVNVCRAAEPLKLGERECMKLRVADNTFGKNTKTMFIDAIVSGPDTDVSAKLAAGDQIVISGTLKLGEYKAKKGKLKGKMVATYEIPFCKILQVTKSPTFFSEEEEASDEPETLDNSEPDLSPAEDAGDVEDPLADLE